LSAAGRHREAAVAAAAAERLRKNAVRFDAEGRNCAKAVDCDAVAIAADVAVAAEGEIDRAVTRAPGRNCKPTRAAGAAD
jgi:hypothetical protein